MLVVAMLVGAMATSFAQEKDPTDGLKLRPAQRNELKARMNSGREKMRATRDDLRTARMELFHQLQQYRFDNKRVQNTVLKINGIQRRLMRTSLDTQKGLRQILTRDQFKQLGQMIDKRGKNAGRSGRESWQGFDVPKDMDIKRLRLSDDQQKRIKRLFDKSENTSEQLAARRRGEMQNLRKLYLNYDLDQKKVNAQMDKVGDIELAILKQTVARQSELRRILTESQFKSLVKTIKPPPRWRDRNRR